VEKSGKKSDCHIMRGGFAVIVKARGLNHRRKRKELIKRERETIKFEGSPLGKSERYLLVTELSSAGRTHW